MLRRIYEVTYTVKYAGVGTPVKESMSVLANGDGMHAIAKAKRKALKDDKLYKGRVFRLLELKILAEAHA